MISMASSVRKPILVLVACAFALGLAACGGDENRTPEDVPVDAIALVGDEEIPKSEYDALLAQAEKNFERQNQEFPKAGTPEFDTLKGQTVTFLVQQAQYEQAAGELGVEVTDEEIDKRLEKVKKDFYDGSDAKFEADLEKQGLTLKQVRDNLAARILQDEIIAALAKEAEPVTDKDIEAYYNKNEQQFSQPASREVRHILVKAKGKADDIYGQLKGGANFAALAKKFSQDPGSKDQGGKLTVTKGQTVAPFDKAAFSLGVRELSRPIKTQFGWHVIQPLGEVTEATSTPLAKVKEQISQTITEQRKGDAVRKWVESVRKKYKNQVVYAAGYEPAANKQTTTSSSG
jgi:foldase protein PrsA